MSQIYCWVCERPLEFGATHTNLCPKCIDLASQEAMGALEIMFKGTNATRYPVAKAALLAGVSALMKMRWSVQAAQKEKAIE